MRAHSNTHTPLRPHDQSSPGHYDSKAQSQSHQHGCDATLTLWRNVTREAMSGDLRPVKHLSVCEHLCVCVWERSRRLWLQKNRGAHMDCAFICVVAARKLSSVIHLHSDPLTHLVTDDGLTLLPAGISATFVLRSNRVELSLLRSPWRLRR